ncbi:hypothetical protein [uncultured Amnibacterium sp.]|uniref:hypothetical protein n=1 Tax=uncultured Amnibacterium sp. TaxID=1631851 RepID=UPI0035CB59FA
MWTDLVAWFQSAAGMRLTDGAIVPFVAIVVAGLVAGLVARGAVRGAVVRAQREATTAVVVAVAEAARRAATAPDRPALEHAADEQFTAEAELRLRLLPVFGAELAADWTASAIAGLRSTAERDGSEVRADLDALRDRLIRWLRAPKQARRLFPKPSSVRPPPASASAPAPASASAKGSKRDARRRSTAVGMASVMTSDTAAGAALESGGRTSPDAPAENPEPTTLDAPANRPSSDAAPVEPLDDQGAQQRALVDETAPSTSPVPLARHVAPATANPPTEDRLGPEPIVDHRSSRQADEDDDADFMQGSDQQGPPPVAATPLRETEPARQ